MEQRTFENKGYTILLSVLIIGAIVGSIAILNLSSGITSLEIAGISKNAAKARALAESCTETGLLQVKMGTQSTSDTLQFTDGLCSYTLEETNASTSILTTYGEVDSVIRHFTITIAKETVGSSTAILDITWLEN